MNPSAESPLGAPTPETPTSLPIRPVFFAALLPALLGLGYGLLIRRPTMGFDPAVGLLAWLNFTEGGTWNTISTLDHNNIAQNLEIPLTWWPPGQYIFLGLLNSLGLSFGGAALFIAFFSTLSGAIGLATLSNDLGAPSRSLAWISGSFACSIYSLTNFYNFGGGEPLIMALWPWVALIGWRLRNRGLLLICTLPILFLTGSFIKHSFAIYSLCILALLALDRVSNCSRAKKDSVLERVKKGLVSLAPLITTGIFYIILRHYLIDTSGSPKSGATYYTYHIKEIWGYVPNAPLLSAFEQGPDSWRIWAKLFNIETDILQDRIISLLAFVSPISISTYLFLAFRKKPLIRFAGITATLSLSLYFILHSVNYAISLEDRHYKQAGALLLAAIAAQITRKEKVAMLARIIVITSIAWGTVRFAQIAYIRQSPTIPLYSGEHGLSVFIDQEIHAELRSSLTKLEDNSIFIIPRPDTMLELQPIRPKTVRLIPIFGHGFDLADSYKGRAPQITIAYPDSWEITEDELKSRFQDYKEEEWDSYTVANWTFLKTKSVVP